MTIPEIEAELKLCERAFADTVKMETGPRPKNFCPVPYWQYFNEHARDNLTDVQNELIAAKRLLSRIETRI